MATLECETAPATRLWPEYRSAFEEFSRKARYIQKLQSLDPEPETLSLAALELEQARIAYNCRRDALVQEFLTREPAKWLRPPNPARIALTQ
jgi:hypothetical protein